MSKNIFISGTGTDVGKTYISGLIVKYLKEKGYKSGYYKAAVSGNEKIDGVLTAGDALFVKNIAKLDEKPNDMVSYIYEEAVSPHLAAIREQIPVELEKIKKDFTFACSKNDYITMEGSGGILCPIRYDDKEKIWLEDIIKMLNLSTFVVGNAKLGSINSFGLTVRYLKSIGIKVKGLIINEYDPEDFMQEDNVKMIEDLTETKIIAKIKLNQKAVDFSGIEELYE